MQDRLLTEKEVAKITGIAPSTLRSHRFYRKGIPYCKIEGSVRYWESNVYSYLEDNTITFGNNAA